MESKKDIRKHALEKRNCITDKDWKEKSYRIYKKVLEHPYFSEADAVYCYVDFRKEVGTRSLMEACWKLGKKVAVPKVEGDNMHFYYIRRFPDLSEGYRGIMEPRTTFLAKDRNALVIMPGAAFDANRNRIGYGKGFYDKFLIRHPDFHTIAIAFECQVVEQIPADEHDIRPEVIITEEHTYDE